jgi:hypothetical protein
MVSVVGSLCGHVRALGWRVVLFESALFPPFVVSLSVFLFFSSPVHGANALPLYTFTFVCNLLVVDDTLIRPAPLRDRCIGV